MCVKLLLFEILVISVIVFKTDAARILAYFPFPSISHQVVFRPLTQELAKRGHQVTIITPDPAFKDGVIPPNITEIDLHEKSYEMWRKILKDNDGESDKALSLIKKTMYMLVDMVEYQINTKEVSDVIKTKQFDLVIVEACIRVAKILSHVFKAPSIQVSSFGSLRFNDLAIGAPSHPLLNPDVNRQRLYNLSFLEKKTELQHEYENRQLYWSLEINENAMLKRNFGSNTPTSVDLERNVDLLLLNVNPIWANNRPVPPNVIYMGGLHQQPIKELPKNLKTFLDSSKHGVIYMSFGTNVDTTLLPSERIQIFCKVFSRLQYDVLWKWNGDELPGRPYNVKISKWLPQADLLHHPKIKLFITQGGLQSTDESISAGVPLIAFPMLGDQWYNAEQYVYHNIGLKMDLKELTEESLEKSIRKVIADPSYRNNVKYLGVVMRNQPRSPLERAVWWTEYVLRHGGAKHLRSPTANISWTEFLMLDVVAVLVITVIFIVSVFALGVRFSLSIFQNTDKKRSKLKNA